MHILQKQSLISKKKKCSHLKFEKYSIQRLNLITGLQKEGCKIVNANTDGLIIEPHGSWSSICDKWEQMLNLKLERKHIKELEQADVNNYRALYSDGTKVLKGAKYKE